MSVKCRGRCDDKRKSGFTIMEALLALSVNTLLLFLMMGGLQVIQASQQQLEKTNVAQWHLFLNQLENELADEVLVQKTSANIYTKSVDPTDKATYSYIFSSNKIVRQKDGTGHHPMLMGIKSVKYEVTNEGISIQAVFADNQTYKAYLVMQKKLP